MDQWEREFAFVEIFAEAFLAGVLPRLHLLACVHLATWMELDFLPLQSGSCSRRGFGSILRV